MSDRPVAPASRAASGTPTSRRLCGPFARQRRLARAATQSILRIYANLISPTSSRMRLKSGLGARHMAMPPLRQGPEFSCSGAQVPSECLTCWTIKWR